jgi:hypothetical protein
MKWAMCDASGYLLRNRPPDRLTDWTEVPVGRAAALRLSHGLTIRDLEIMRFAERFGMVTQEQIRKLFFNSDMPAFKAVMELRKRRFLVRLEIPANLVHASVGRRPGPTNSVLVLDWNGYYYLRYHADGLAYSKMSRYVGIGSAAGSAAESMLADREHMGETKGTDTEKEGGDGGSAGAISRWDPSTVAQVNSRLGHTLGISEVWSYVMAAARATYERPTPQHPEDPIKYRLKAFLLNERESCIPSNLAMLSRGSDRKRVGKFLVIPDATIALSFQVSLPPTRQVPATPSILAIPGDNRPGEQSPTGFRSAGSAGATNRNPDSLLWWPPGGWKEWGASNRPRQPGQSEDPQRHSNQYDPTQTSWQHAFLPMMPFPAPGQPGDAPSPFSARYRFAFVEMETGTNNRNDLYTKIERYNRLYRIPEIWQYMYGQKHFPRVLVVVRSKEQIERTTILWREKFAHHACTAVLVTSLPHLAEVYSFGRRGLIELPCWLDVFGDPKPRWCTLDDALGIDLAVAQAEAARS